MLQIANLEEYTEKDILPLLDAIEPILNKRKQLHRRYTRGGNQKQVLYSINDDTTKLPFEMFLTDLSAGYLSGKPNYSVEVSKDEEKNKILKQVLNKEARDENYARAMQILLDYISDYNDDAQENYQLFHDALEVGACYEILYENNDNELVYSRYDPLQTVATWDYSIPANLTGIVRRWHETDLQGNEICKVELTDKNGSRVYNVINQKEVALDDKRNHEWGDVPAWACEVDFAIFESCEDVIKAYEQLVQNMRNTFQYNDTECKLKVVGYSPREQLTTVDEHGNVIPNPARIIEDKMIADTKVFYIEGEGDVAWISKPMDASGVKEIIKFYQDLLFQFPGVPNTTDLAFNSNDLNASAIDRKFYVMDMIREKVRAGIKKGYTRRWELFFNRLNLKNKGKGINFDFRDIKIELPKNLPSNNDELITSTLKLKDMISNQTIIEKLGYNYYSEKEKMDKESTDNLMSNIERTKTLADNGITTNEAEVNTEEDDE